MKVVEDEEDKQSESVKIINRASLQSPTIKGLLKSNISIGGSAEQNIL